MIRSNPVRRQLRPQDACVKEILSWGPAGPLPNTTMLDFGVILGVRSVVRSPYVNLTHLWISPSTRNRGIGTAVVQRVQACATVYCLSITLRPTAFDRGTTGLTTSQLVAWYTKLGFRPLGSKIPQRLVWEPPF